MYDLDISESKEFETILRILKEDAYRVLPIESGLEYITT